MPSNKAFAMQGAKVAFNGRRANLGREVEQEIRNAGGEAIYVPSDVRIEDIIRFGIYNGTKFALEGISEALAKEVAPFNVNVTIVEPGSFRTDWAGRMMRAENVIDDYVETSGETRSWMDEENGTQQGDPAKAAEAMIEVVYSANPP